jgi:hypothetical protein
MTAPTMRDDVAAVLADAMAGGAPAPDPTAWGADAIAAVLVAAGLIIRHHVPDVVKAWRSIEVDAKMGAMHSTMVDVRAEDGGWLLRAQYREGGWSAPEPVTDEPSLRAALAAALATVEPTPPLVLAVRTTVDVAMADLYSLMVSALDGPLTGQWIRSGSYSVTLPEGFKVASLPWTDAGDRAAHDDNGVRCDYFAPLVPGGRIEFRENDDDREDEDDEEDPETGEVTKAGAVYGTPRVFDLASVERGLAIMARDYPRHFADIATDADATTADVFVQCCVLGEVVYG